MIKKRIEINLYREFRKKKKTVMKNRDRGITERYKKIRNKCF